MGKKTELHVVETPVEEPKRKKVALIGTAPSSMMKAPFSDPNFEVWALSASYHHIPRFTRWFEMHDREEFKDDLNMHGTTMGEYLKWLQRCPVPVYTPSVDPEWPTSVAYPIQEVLDKFKVRYFNSTFDYMIALAIMEGFNEIHLYGVDMAKDTEYAEQRPSCEFWLGVIKGMEIAGVDISFHIPEESDILKSGHLYGIEKKTPDEKKAEMRRKELQGFLDAVKKKEMATLAEKYQILGALQENGLFIRSRHVGVR